MATRVSVWTNTGITTQLYVLDCANCGVIFAITRDYEDRRRNDARTFYCPNGHTQSWHESESDRLRKERDSLQASELALTDQLTAAIRDGEQTRAALIRDRARFAAGVCPCCNRSFENVRRHMSTKHPEYDVERVARAIEFRCSCGRKFDTYKGLRIHQGHQRRYLDDIGESWDDPGQGRYWAHLTEVKV